MSQRMRGTQVHKQASYQTEGLSPGLGPRNNLIKKIGLGWDFRDEAPGWNERCRAFPSSEWAELKGLLPPEPNPGLKCVAMWLRSSVEMNFLSLIGVVYGSIGVIFSV